MTQAEMYALVTKLVAVISSCRTHAQIKAARRYLALACRREPALHRDYYNSLINKVAVRLIAENRPRLILTRQSHKMPTLTIEDYNDADQ